MKKHFRLLIVAIGITTLTPSLAQKDNVGIGTTKPDQSAVLDVSSTSKGFLTPRMSAYNRNAIQNPAEGLIVYQTDQLSGLYFYNGKEWKSVTEAKSILADPNDWTMAGNSITGTEFLGTTNSQPLNFKVNNEASGFISPTLSSMFFGYRSGFSGAGGSANLGVGNRSLESLTSGSSNTGLGSESLRKVTSGNFNLGIGGFSLNNLTTGSGNIAIGHGAMVVNVSGSDNVAIGADALFEATSSGNTGIGKSSLVRLTSGGNNLAIGLSAGANLTTGGNNVLIGTNAAQGEATISNKLYITNSSTTSPLVYGDFSAKFLSVGDVPDAKRGAIAAAGIYGLLVQKGILTEKLKVATLTTTDWADYVFEQEYKAKMMSLEEIEKYTLDNKHLPNVPSAEEMVKTGLDYTQTSKMFMEKIEELTLYMIEMNKEIKALKAENRILKKK